MPDHIDLLTSLYMAPGPYLSAYMRRLSTDERLSPPGQRFDDHRSALHAAGASEAALDAVAARLQLPIPDDMGGQAVLAADDGTTVAATGHEGPVRDFFIVETLPYAAPLIEWDHWRIDHVVVLVRPDVIELVSFLEGQSPSVQPLGPSAADAVASLTDIARQHRLGVLAVAGPERAADEIVRALRGVVPPGTDVVAVGEDDTVTSDKLAHTLVRLVADRVARQTVALLREFRFMLGHDEVANGLDASVEALAAGRGRMLLLHDDPDDTRRAWFGADGRAVARERTPSCPSEGRLTDVLIRSAVLQEIDVRVVPSTGDRGPVDDVAVLLSAPAQLELE